jgi:hypothetical protein
MLRPRRVRPVLVVAAAAAAEVVRRADACARALRLLGNPLLLTRQ